MSPIIMEDDETTATRPSVVPSIAVSLSCAMCGVPSAQRVGARLEPPDLSSGFWDDTSSTTGDEVVLLAHLTGALSTDDFSVLAHALQGRIGGPRTFRLATESEENRRRIQERVSDLRSSARRRRAYVEMLDEVWKSFRSSWEGPTGRRARRTVDRYVTELAAGRSWRSLAPTPKREALLDRVLAEVGRDIPIVLAPSISMGGMFVLDVEDAIVVGLPVPEAGAEEQAEEMARQLKAVAHPTRLAIVREVARRPATVGELARTFRVAQPTMTNHLRQLRDAGIVRRDDRTGRAFSLDRRVAQELAEGLAELAGLGSAQG